MRLRYYVGGSGRRPNAAPLVLITNNTPLELVVYSSPLHARIGTVSAMGKRCIRLRAVYTQEVIFYARMVGASHRIFSPPMRFDQTTGWHWVVSSIMSVHAMDLRPIPPCGLKRT